MTKGYKVLDIDMKPIYGNKNMTYELDKVYEMPEEDLKICKIGFHYYKKLEDITQLYSLNSLEDRIFEVEILGKEITDDNIKYCTNKIKLVRELTEYDIDKYIINYAEEFITHDSWEVRKEIADRGYKLDLLIHDVDCDVRAAVARQGYGLDILINDSNVYVRKTVAEQGYGLEKLALDSDVDVRKEAIKMISIMKGRNVL